MAPGSICSRLRRRIGVVAGLVSIGVFSPASAAASPWDLPPPPTTLAGNSSLLGGESALLRTWSSQGIKADARPALALTSAAVTPSPFRNWAAMFARPDKTGGFGSESAQAYQVPQAPQVAHARATTRSATGGPDVFGSTALPIGTTPYDSMWRRASAGHSGALNDWTSGFADLRGGDRLRLLRAVNGWVNQRVDFVEDNVAGVPAEIWQNAAESLARGRGDCEDYALAKLALLAALGVDRDDLFLVIARDLVARSHHAVLAVRINGRFVILDNATDELVEGDRANDYRPIFSYSAGGRWIHGYSGTPAQPPIQIAAAMTAITAP